MLPALLPLLAVGVVKALSAQEATDSIIPPLPLVVWHGMGDTCCNPLSIGGVDTALEKRYGATLVHGGDMRVAICCTRIAALYWTVF
jgi:hypothetical protein